MRCKSKSPKHVDRLSWHPPRRKRAIGRLYGGWGLGLTAQTVVCRWGFPTGEPLASADARSSSVPTTGGERQLRVGRRCASSPARGWCMRRPHQRDERARVEVDNHRRASRTASVIDAPRRALSGLAPRTTPTAGSIRPAWTSSAMTSPSDLLSLALTSRTRLILHCDDRITNEVTYTQAAKLRRSTPSRGARAEHRCLRRPATDPSCGFRRAF